MLDFSLMNGSIISSGCLKVDPKSQIKFHNLSYATEIYNGVGSSLKCDLQMITMGYPMQGTRHGPHLFAY